MEWFFLTERLAGVTERLAGVAERLAGVVERLAGVAERLAGVVERLAGVSDAVLVRRESMVAVVEPSSPVNLLAVKYRLFRPLVLRVVKWIAHTVYNNCT